MQPLPIYRSKNLELLALKVESGIELPLVAGISAGFPSPAADFIDVNIDLVKELVKNPSSTFLARVKGDSMEGAGIGDGDILIIDKSLEFEDNCIAVAYINGEFTVKRIKKENNSLWLIPANEKYNSVKIAVNDEFAIWGLVTKIIKDVKNVRTRRL